MNENCKEELQRYQKTIGCILPVLLDESNIETRSKSVNFLKGFISYHEKDHSLTAVYRFFIMMRCILTAIKSTNTPRQIDTSKFVAAILNAFQTGTTFRKNEGGVDNASERIKLETIENTIQYIYEKLLFFNDSVEKEFHLKYFDIPSYKAKDKRILKNNAILDAVENLFNYCAEKELDSQSNSNKRQKVYDVLQCFFIATTSDDYVELFKGIAEGIQASRQKGQNGAKSRGSEYALIQLQEALVYHLLINSTSKVYLSFNETQLKTILENISYKTTKDANISSYTTEVIDLLESQIQDRRSMRLLRIQYIERLLLEIPDKINGMTVDKAQTCFEKGSAFAKAITALLGDPILGAETPKVAALGFIWNQLMLAAVKVPENKPKMTKAYLVTISDILLQNIKDSPLLSKKPKRTLM